MGRFIDLTGQKYNRWTVIRFIERIETAYFWLCRCECGTEKAVRRATLRKGTSISCGCWRKESTSKRFSKRTGEANPMYTTGKSLGRGKAQHDFKESIRIRDKHTCLVCGKTQAESRRKLDVHHLNAIRDDDRPENAATLCRTCHRAEHGSDAVLVQHHED